MSTPEEQHERSEDIQSDAELSGDDLEEAAGGIIIGGCVPGDKNENGVPDVFERTGTGPFGGPRKL